MNIVPILGMGGMMIIPKMTRCTGKRGGGSQSAEEDQKGRGEGFFQQLVVNNNHFEFVMN